LLNIQGQITDNALGHYTLRDLPNNEPIEVQFFSNRHFGIIKAFILPTF